MVRRRPGRQAPDRASLPRPGGLRDTRARTQRPVGRGLSRSTRGQSRPLAGRQSNNGSTRTSGLRPGRAMAMSLRAKTASPGIPIESPSSSSKRCRPQDCRGSASTTCDTHTQRPAGPAGRHSPQGGKRAPRPCAGVDDPRHLLPRHPRASGKCCGTHRGARRHLLKVGVQMEYKKPPQAASALTDTRRLQGLSKSWLLG